MTISHTPATIELTSTVSCARWRAPFQQTALGELADGMKAAAEEADRLLALVPAAFNRDTASVEVQPKVAYSVWEVRIVAREPYTDDEEPTEPPVD